MYGAIDGGAAEMDRCRTWRNPANAYMNGLRSQIHHFLRVLLNFAPPVSSLPHFPNPNIFGGVEMLDIGREGAAKMSCYGNLGT